MGSELTLFGGQPHRSKSFKLSNHPLFIEKVRDIGCPPGASMARPCPLSARTPSSLRLAASMPDPLQLRFARQDTLLVLYAVGESGRWIGIIPPLCARFALRFPRRIASPSAKAFKGKDRAAGAVSSLWWPRRPLATLGRKLRQGRKAATVSIDAGAEVSRRGRHPHLFEERHSGRSMPLARACPRLRHHCWRNHSPTPPDAANRRRLRGSARASRSAPAP